MNKKLYVGNLLYETTDDQLRDFFAQFGAVTSAQVIRYQDTGRSKGFGFVEMATEEEAQKAIDGANGQNMGGRNLVVSEARPPRERSERGGGFGGGRGPRRGGFGGGNRGGYGGNRGGGYGGGNGGGYGNDGGDFGGGDMNG